MRKHLLLTLLYACSLQMALQAQAIDFNRFKSLESAGMVPEDFTRLASEKYYEDVADLKSKSRSEQKDQEEFLLASNFLIDEMLHSGRVIFGDPVTEYLNKIKDEILSSNKELSDDIRVYTLVSNEVNAFTADNGIVLVTTGLVAQAQNEAQIAFILCHEFSHFYKKHAIDNYVENQRIERGVGVYNSLDNDEVDLEKFKYSKELESDADEQGIKYYKKTKYSYNAVRSVFDVLLYSYLPFNEVEFPKDYFNDGFYVLPGKYFIDTLAEITAAEDYDDAESTHPNIKKRKTTMLGIIDDDDNTNRFEYIQSEEQFKYVQKICRYQGCEMYLYDIEYEDALYQAFLLQEEDTSSLYLKQVIAQSLYGLSMYKNAGSTPDWHRYYKKVEGESQQLFYFFSKINAKELNTLALKFAWDAHVADPENGLISKICDQLGYEMVNTSEYAFSEFYSAQKVEKYKASLAPVKTDSVGTTEVTNTQSKTSKYEKIKKETATVDEKAAYWKFAFADYIDDSNFEDIFVKEEEEEGDKKSSKNKNDRPEYHLGVNQIVMVDPIYVEVDERRDIPVQYEAAESAKIELRDKVKTSAEDLNLKVKYLDYHTLKADDVELFNDLSILNRWLSEKISHLDEEVYMHTSTNDDFLALSKKYDINNFAWMGVVSFTEPESYKAAKILACIYLPLAPFLIYDIVTPDRSSFYFALVADAETGKFKMQYYNSNNMRNSDAAQKSNIYYILQQIKSKPKKK